MPNFEALKQMPLKNFANMVFEIVRRDCKDIKDFEDFLRKEIPQSLEETAQKALQNLQCLNKN